MLLYLSLPAVYIVNVLVKSTSLDTSWSLIGKLTLCSISTMCDDDWKGANIGK